MKKFPILVLGATVAITPAYAETDINYNTPVTKLSTQDTDLSFAFDDVENLQATDMTLAEMQETEGAALPLAYMGGAALFGSMVNVNTYVRAVPSLKELWVVTLLRLVVGQ